ncbi:ATPase Cu transporting protein 7B [Chytridiales sp. JEL 0842]|nr:ATPase Cu transporting protein 7B [Chytridiales sp. JEL 0842]
MPKPGCPKCLCDLCIQRLHPSRDILPLSPPKQTQAPRLTWSKSSKSQEAGDRGEAGGVRLVPAKVVKRRLPIRPEIFTLPDSPPKAAPIEQTACKPLPDVPPTRSCYENEPISSPVVVETINHSTANTTDSWIRSAFPNHAQTLPFAKTKIHVRGFSCPHCLETVKRVLEGMKGIESLSTGEAGAFAEREEGVLIVRHDVAVMKGEEVKVKVEALGFEVKEVSSTDDGTENPARLVRATFTLLDSLVASTLPTLIRLLRNTMGIQTNRTPHDITYSYFPYPRVCLVFSPLRIGLESVETLIKRTGFEVLDVHHEDVHTSSSSDVVGDTESNSQTSRLVNLKLCIENLKCLSCVGGVQEALKEVEGVRGVEVDLHSKKAKVLYDSREVGPRNLMAVVEKMGYKVSLQPASSVYAKLRAAEKKQLELAHTQIFISICCLIPILFIVIVGQSLLPVDNPLRMELDKEVIPGMSIATLFVAICSTVGQVALGWRYYRDGFDVLRHTRSLNPGVLIILASTAVYIYSLCLLIYCLVNKTPNAECLFFSTSVILLFLAIGGRILQIKAWWRITSSWETLVNLKEGGEVILVEGFDKDGVERREVRVDESVELKETRIAIELVHEGDILKIPIGSWIPCDGVLVHGTTNVDESCIAGEKQPTAKSVGDDLLGGALNVSSEIYLRVTETGNETHIAHLINLLTQSQTHPSNFELRIDTLVHYFTPALFVIALVVFTIWIALFYSTILPTAASGIFLALKFSLGVLVISSPISLAWAVPSVVMVSATLAVRQSGVLVQRGLDAFQRGSKVRAVAFEKTGVLTRGCGEVTGAVVLEGVCWVEGRGWVLGTQLEGDSERGVVWRQMDVWRVVEKVGGFSTHLLATALQRHAKAKVAEENLKVIEGVREGVFEVENVREHQGLGMVADVKRPVERSSEAVKSRIFIGSPAWMSANGISFPNADVESQMIQKAHRWQDNGKTTIFIGIKTLVSALDSDEPHPASTSPQDHGCIVAVVSILDPLRPSAKPAVRALMKSGVVVYILSGDNERTCLHIARELGLPAENVWAGIKTGDKVNKVKTLKKIMRRGGERGAVGFVGDAGEDGAALRVADVGIGIRGGRSPKRKSMEEGIHAILFRADLRDVYAFLDLSKVTMKRAKMNVIFVVLYHFLAVGVAGGLFYPFVNFVMEPWIGMVIMMIASAVVVASSTELKRYKAPILLESGDEIGGTLKSYFSTMRKSLYNIATTKGDPMSSAVSVRSVPNQPYSADAANEPRFLVAVNADKDDEVKESAAIQTPRKRHQEISFSSSVGKKWNLDISKLSWRRGVPADLEKGSCALIDQTKSPSHPVKLENTSREMVSLSSVKIIPPLANVLPDDIESSFDSAGLTDCFEELEDIKRVINSSVGTQDAESSVLYESALLQDAGVRLRRLVEARQAVPESIYLLGKHVLWGTFSPPSSQEAFYLFKTGMNEYQDVDCTIAAAECYLEGVGAEADMRAGLNLLRKASKKGDVSAKLRLGCTLVGGVCGSLPKSMGGDCFEGISNEEKNEVVEGVQWLESAVEQVFAAEALRKSTGYKEKSGVLKEDGDDNDRKWIAEGLYLLGAVYQFGIEGKITKEPRKSLALYKQSARKSHGGAQTALGLIHELHLLEGVAVDSNRSISWYQRAVKDHQVAEAGLGLSRWYRRGFETVVGQCQSDDEALRWERWAKKRMAATALH